MKKIAFGVLIIVFVFFSLTDFLAPSKFALAESSLAGQEAYQAVVQVKNFTLDSQYSFGLYGQGSGVIISADGLLLTNHHVVVIEEEFDNTQRDSIYQVCITKSIDAAPDCSYLAQLIAADKDYDIALLKIEAIEGLSLQTTFPYLDLNPTSEIQVNDPITALGYPTIGGDTITITNGVVSGKMDLYGKKWIKSDAVISYGSSGGAAVDAEGNLIGINTQAYFDTIGSLGYIIDIASVDNWISSNQNKTPRRSLLTNRLIDFTTKQRSLETNSTFENSYPNFSLTKPVGWDFDYNDENLLMIEKGSDDESGSIAVFMHKNAYQLKLDNIVPVTKRLYGDMGLLSVMSIIRDEPISLNAYQGKKLTFSIRGEIINMYMFPYQEYMLQIIYDYGTDDKDKTAIDNALNSIRIMESGLSFGEVKKYIHTYPSFSLTATGNWSIQINNSKTSPLSLMNKSVQEAYVDIGFAKVDDDTKDFNNDEYLKHMQQQIKDLNQLGSVLDLKTEVASSDAHYRATHQLDNVIMMESVAKSATTDEVLSRSLGYVFKASDNFVAIGLDVYSDDQAIYQSAKTEFSQLMQDFSIQGYCSSCGGEQTDSSDQPTVPEIPDADIDQDLTNRLKGYMLLQVQQGGRIWWVRHENGRRYEVTFANALNLFREHALGISNDNLAKIKSNIDQIDPDKDSDGDGYTDRTEVASGYNPFSRSTAKVWLDNNLAQQSSGKFLLQVEDGGRIWYVAPQTLEKYEVTWSNLMDLFRALALGITDSDLDKIAEN